MKIETLVKAQVSDLKQLQVSSNACLQKTIQGAIIKKNCLIKYGDRGRFLVTFNPDRQTEFCKDVGRCYFGAAPTLGVLRTTYGENMPASWLVPQLTNLSEYCGCKEKLTEAQLMECAKIIALTFCYLKVTELMLFFFYFKSGRYGRFYGNIDPLIITTSLRQFCTERSDIYFRHESEIQKMRIEKSMQNNISHEEYLKQKTT